MTGSTLEISVVYYPLAYKPEEKVAAVVVGGNLTDSSTEEIQSHFENLFGRMLQGIVLDLAGVISGHERLRAPLLGLLQRVSARQIRLIFVQPPVPITRILEELGVRSPELYPSLLSALRDFNVRGI